MKDMISADIQKAEETLKQNCDDALLKTHKELDGKYSAFFADWGMSMFGYTPDSGFNYNYVEGLSAKHNIEIMVNRLKGLHAQGMTLRTDDQGLVINNNISNEINIDISFESARENVSSMTALPESEIGEILGRINELEIIVKSPDSKNKKWNNAKGIVKWIADKGVDVAIALLPLLLQIK